MLFHLESKRLHHPFSFPTFWLSSCTTVQRKGRQWAFRSCRSFVCENPSSGSCCSEASLKSPCVLRETDVAIIWGKVSAHSPALPRHGERERARAGRRASTWQEVMFYVGTKTRFDRLHLKHLTKKGSLTSTTEMTSLFSPFMFSVTVTYRVCT